MYQDDNNLKVYQVTQMNSVSDSINALNQIKLKLKGQFKVKISKKMPMSKRIAYFAHD